MKIKISNEVKEALKNNVPVVALESTIISHGMPYPKNVITALKVEEMIRKIDPLTLSPLEALNMLFEMKKKVK